jgi:hypothetical protein
LAADAIQPRSSLIDTNVIPVLRQISSDGECDGNRD